ncbi:uroporphyrinogen-III synthase [Pseudactinotalea sp. Z1739]|uniref:uroporphyrinogen-III synthase n=1 Tax=Pseudactinotalea sp. Z1739 TaxID=3413028 RepID=UPI003C7CAA25
MTEASVSSDSPAPGSPLSGLRVLVPRAGAEDPIARAVREAGAVPVTVALTETVPAHDTVMERALALGGAAWLVLTSARTVSVLADYAARTGTPLGERLRRAVAAGTRLAVVGPATAAALAGIGHPPHLCATAPESARTLLAGFPRPGGGGRVILPCSALAAPELVRGLRERGWDVDRQDVYTTRGADLDAAARARLTEPWPDVILLTAGSTVRALVALLGPPPSSTAIAVIGDPTRRAAEQAGLRVGGVAPEATPAGLIAAAAQSLRHCHPDPGADH